MSKIDVTSLETIQNLSHATVLGKYSQQPPATWHYILNSGPGPAHISDRNGFITVTPSGREEWILGAEVVVKPNLEGESVTISWRPL